MQRLTIVLRYDAIVSRINEFREGTSDPGAGSQIFWHKGIACHAKYRLEVILKWDWHIDISLKRKVCPILMQESTYICMCLTGKVGRIGREWSCNEMESIPSSNCKTCASDPETGPLWQIATNSSYGHLGWMGRNNHEGINQDYMM